MGNPTGSGALTADLGGTVLIVGGGIGGLTAALALRHFGVPVAVFEQAHELREIGAGVTLTPNAMHALDFLGVGQRIGAAAGPTKQYEVCDYRDQRVLERGPLPATIERDFGAGYFNVHRADLHSALAEAVAGDDPGAIHLNHRFVHLEQGDGTVTAEFANGARYRGAALIGCDGGASRVRTTVFGGEEVQYTGQTAFRAVVPMTPALMERIGKPYRLYVGQGRTLIHYPLRKNSLMNLLGIALEPSWQDEGWSIPATVEEFLALFDDFPGAVRDLIGSVPEATLFKWGLRDRDPLDEWTRGRVTMLGDAAHPFMPFLGQGACIAIEDGLVLGRALGSTPDLEQAFARYESARKGRANAIQLASRDQARQHQGSTSVGPNPGRTAAARGLYTYNPVTVPV